MAHEKSALYHLGSVVMDLTDDLHAIAMRDGEIDAAERHVIDITRYISRELEKGDRARLRAQAIENSWSLDDSPHTARMIRELNADLGHDDDPTDGSPMRRAA
jgi:hypothetical protein